MSEAFGSCGSVLRTMRYVWLTPRFASSVAHVATPSELTEMSVAGECRVCNEMPPRHGKCLQPRSACCETLVACTRATNVLPRLAVRPPARNDPELCVYARGGRGRCVLSTQRGGKKRETTPGRTNLKYDGATALSSFPGSGAPSRPLARAVLAEKRARRRVRKPSCVHRTTKRSFGPAVNTSPTAVVPSPRQERKRPWAVTREIQRPSRKISLSSSFCCAMLLRTDTVCATESGSGDAPRSASGTCGGAARARESVCVCVCVLEEL